MHKILNIITLTTILTLTITATSLAAWQLTLDISTPDPNADTGTATNKLTIGTDPTATDAYDNKLDTVALLKGPVQAYVSHPEYPSHQQKLWRDFRKDSLPQEWEIEVQSEANKPVNITWQIDDTNNLKLILIDKETNQEISMTPLTEYSYSSNPTTPKTFLLKASEKTANLSPAPGNGSSGGSGKGGGCGTIKSDRQRRDSMDDYGLSALSVIVLLAPLLLPLQQYIRHHISGVKTPSP